MDKRILVTGGNTGIGYALCKQLASKGCHVFLCSRNTEKGSTAVKSILDEVPSAKVDLVQCDTSQDESVQAAAAAVKEKLAGETLFALVNNAGAGLAQGGLTPDCVVNTNLYGPKRVCEAFMPMLQESGARIVMVGSGAASGFVSKNGQYRSLLCSWDTTWEQLEDLVQAKPYDADSPLSYYGFSKAGLHTYARILAQKYPNILTSTISPGFIQTNMTKGFGATKSPDEGTVSIHKALFEELPGNGFYYGSDGLRSPLHYMRDPGTPEYLGTEDYDQGH